MTDVAFESDRGHGDMADQAMISSEVEIGAAMKLVRGLQKERADICRSLQGRKEPKTCIGCGGEIPARRLAAISYAVRCTSCEEARESLGVIPRLQIVHAAGGRIL